MQKGSHTQYDIQYHIVWMTKHKKKIIEGKIVGRLKTLLMQGCSAKKIKIIKGNIQPQYVHLLISAPPSLSVSQIMQYLKEKSSEKLQEEFPKLKEQFWGQLIWAPGYFCASTGTITNEMIKEYLENKSIENTFQNKNMF